MARPARIPRTWRWWGNILVQSATDAVYGYRLWKSDGTSSCTVMVADINDTTSANPTNHTNVDRTLFFVTHAVFRGLYFRKRDAVMGEQRDVERYENGRRHQRHRLR
jgi:ELWxxDGT repeat protein